MMRTLLQDLRFGTRILNKNRVFTITTVLILALGIGANTTIFSVINALLLRSLPVQAPDELVLLSMDKGDMHDDTFSYPLYEQLRDESRSVFGLIAVGSVGPRRMIASELGGTDSEFVHSQEVSGNFFAVLGVPAAIGRTLKSEDDQAGKAQPVVVISHSFWQQRFGGDPGVIGKTITLDDVPFTLIGVAPKGFFGIEVGANPDFWMPMQMIPQVDKDEWGQRLGLKNYWWMRILGRVAPGTDADNVGAELNVLFHRYLNEYTATMPSNKSAEEKQSFLNQKLELLPGHNGWTRLRQQYRQPLWILMATVGLVLLIACANVAGLLMARGSVRVREFTLRVALGANRFRIVRQLLTESLLLSLMGGLLGVLVAQWGIDGLLSCMDISRDTDSFNLTPDKNVLAFTVSLLLITGLISGLAHALRCSRLNLVSALKGVTGGMNTRFSQIGVNRILVVMQVALSMVVLIGVGLFVRTLVNLKGQDVGFIRDRVVLFDVGSSPGLDPTRKTLLYKELHERLESLPGVHSVSLTSMKILSGGRWTNKISAEGSEADSVEDLTCHGMMVSPRYFESMGITLLSGRDFNAQDEPFSMTATQRVAVINEAMARRYFGRGNPLGKYFFALGHPEMQFEIVGIVKDAKYASLREPSPPTFYLPITQALGSTFVLRTNIDPYSVMPSIRQVVGETDPTLQVRELKTLDEIMDASLTKEWLITEVAGLFGLVALILSCLGLYGVLSCVVAQRVREIGIRMALGARRYEVLSLVIGQGLKLVWLGAGLGLIITLFANRVVSNLLYGVTPTDPLTLAGISLLLLTVALLACYIPARRAAKVNPMEALRYE